MSRHPDQGQDPPGPHHADYQGLPLDNATVPASTEARTRHLADSSRPEPEFNSFTSSTNKVSELFSQILHLDELDCISFTFSTNKVPEFFSHILHLS